MRTTGWAWCVVLVLGCRDLSLPTTNGLSISRPFDTVAPRQRMTLAASGGSGAGYVFRFAPGGNLSGASASLTESGEYQAGERGLAQDVLRVTDGAGNVAETRVAVGAPLSVTPPIAIVAPGGELQFVTSGGQPPYRLTQGDGGVLVDGLFRADSSGDRIETITVTDATNDPLATARAQLSIGSGLVIYPVELQVAPRETLTFVALGGQPPYRFSLSSLGSSGSVAAGIDPLTGRYQAGSNELDAGTSLDVVTVTDRNGLSTEARVSVGPALRASVPTSVRPGEQLVIEVIGGKAPYAFEFASHGNRSNGTVEGRTGVYVPGATPLAVDLLQVRDAVGTVTPLAPVTLGPLEFATPWGRGASQLAEADLDLDQHPDLIAVNARQAEVASVLNVSRPTQSIVRTPLGPTGAQQLVVVAPRIVLGVGTQDVWVHEASASGELVTRAGAGVGLGDTARASWDGERYLYRAARNPGVCVGVERVDTFRLIYRLSGQPQCVAPVASRLFAVGTQRTATESYAYWLPDPTFPDTTPNAGPIEFAYFDTTLNTPTITRTAQLPLPGGTVIGTGRLGSLTALGQLLDDRSALGSDRVLALLSAADGGASMLWGFAGSGPTPLFAPLPLALPMPAVGITATGGTPSLVASWDGVSGRVLLHELQADGGVAPRQLLDVPTSVSAAAFVDVNGDRVKDLVTSDQQTGRQVMLFGEGDGTFSRRPRFRVTNDPLTRTLQADLDEDGALDVVAATGQSVQVFWGSAREPSQLAAGPLSRLGLTPSSLRLVRRGPGEHDLVVTDSRGGVVVASGDATGVFGAPRPLTSSDGSVERALFTISGPAELGGTAPGPDFLVQLWSAPTGFYALLRDAGDVARLVLVSPARQCDFRKLTLDASGPDAVLFGCHGSTPGTTELFTARLQGGTFGALSPVTGGPLAGFYAGFVELPEGGYAVQTVGGLHRPVVQGATVSIDSVQTAAVVSEPMFAQLDPAAARPQLVGLENQNLNEVVVQAWNGTRYVEQQRLRVGRQQALYVLRRGASKRDELLLQSQNGDVFVLTNDGTGGVR